MTGPLTDRRLAEIQAALAAVTANRPSDSERALAYDRWSVHSAQYATELHAELWRLRGELATANDAITAAVHRLQTTVPPLEAERDQAVKRWHLEHERAETLEAENAELHARISNARAEIRTQGASHHAAECGAPVTSLVERALAAVETHLLDPGHRPADGSGR